MNQNDLIVITGVAGFIGSYLTGYLNKLGYTQLILVDDFSIPAKQANLANKQFHTCIDRSEFFAWAQQSNLDIKAVFHLGARTDTTEMDYAVHKKWNLDYSIAMWELCVQRNIPLVYASSAATYGNGEHGYVDSHTLPAQLHPLNPYGESKNNFDIWAVQQAQQPPFWAGLKFFNVYGSNEYHKGRMASVIFHAFNQIKAQGSVKLFRSHNPQYSDGGQIRDFIYVADVVSIATWLMQTQPTSGLYNTGTGIARTFNDLVTAIFDTLALPVQINYIDTPLDIRDKYQYFTEADMHKLHQAGYNQAFHSLEEGVQAYVNQYLKEQAYY